MTFFLTWFFPNLKGGFHTAVQGRYYASKFDSALAVAKYVAGNEQRLVGDTLLWRETWYDSTLPYWFLDRTFLNTSILASSTSYRFADGRFWGWEGVGCCPGTCGHVWYYAQAPGRLFPDVMREQREQVDFGPSLQADGDIHFRGESNDFPAIDAQAGYILQALREHQMSSDGAFLARIWPKVKRAMEWMIARDGTGDGIIKGNQHNTLDADWFGPVAWLSGLYLAALVAAAEMADEVQDAAYAARCRDIAAKGRERMVKELFDGEYFSNKVDPEHLDADEFRQRLRDRSGDGAELGIPNRSATRAAGKGNAGGAPVAVALQLFARCRPVPRSQQTGPLVCDAGRSGAFDVHVPARRLGLRQGQRPGQKGVVGHGYFNECMNGFEHQVAGHMIWEGMVLEGLAVERAVHDRYHAARRNPWNEVECGDHYARSMASYGVFLAACGFEYHGPKGHIGFAPRLTPENFRAPFTSAEGWGSFEQNSDGNGMKAALTLKYGRLRVRSIGLAVPEKVPVSGISVTSNGHRHRGDACVIRSQIDHHTRRRYAHFRRRIAQNLHSLNAPPMNTRVFLLALLCTVSSVFPSQGQEPWQTKLKKELPLLGHRNWIVIADSAYPWQTAPGHRDDRHRRHPARSGPCRP